MRVKTKTARLQFIHLRMKVQGVFEVQFARGVVFFEMTFLNFLEKFGRDESEKGK